MSANRSPPIPHRCGAVTAIAALVAIAAATALPPRARARRPACVASWSALATTACGERAEWDRGEAMTRNLRCRGAAHSHRAGRGDRRRAAGADRYVRAVAAFGRTTAQRLGDLRLGGSARHLGVQSRRLGNAALAPRSVLVGAYRRAAVVRAA